MKFYYMIQKLKICVINSSNLFVNSFVCKIQSNTKILKKNIKLVAFLVKLQTLEKKSFFFPNFRN